MYKNVYGNKVIFEEINLDLGFLGVYALSAVIVDKAEPSEALKANTVWSKGFNNPTHLLSSTQLDNFRRGEAIHEEVDIKAEKGAYFMASEIELASQSDKNWMFVANVNQSISNIIEVSETIQNTPDISNLVQKDIDLGTENLIKIAGNADGLQLTQDQLINTRHFANTLFNIMRGGIFDDDYNKRFSRTE